MNKACLVCGHHAFLAIHRGTLLRCRHCGFTTANLDIGAQALEQVYTEKYFKGEEYEDYLRDKNVLQMNFRDRLQRISRVIGTKDMVNVLEIGCAYGFFAETLHQFLPSVSYTGYDVVPEAVAHARNVLHRNAICADYLEAAPDGAFSDVFLWDVIEHLPQPEAFIAKIASETRPGGRMYITTGDIGRLLPRLQGPRWRLIHPPSHLHYFTRSSLGRLLEKNGYEVVHVSYPPVRRSIKLIFYSLFMLRKRPSRSISNIYGRIPERWNIPLNTFDIMFVIARKR